MGDDFEKNITDMLKLLNNDDKGTFNPDQPFDNIKLDSSSLEKVGGSFFTANKDNFINHGRSELEHRLKSGKSWVNPWKTNIIRILERINDSYNTLYVYIQSLVVKYISTTYKTLYNLLDKTKSLTVMVRTIFDANFLQKILNSASESISEAIYLAFSILNMFTPGYILNGFGEWDYSDYKIQFYNRYVNLKEYILNILGKLDNRSIYYADLVKNYNESKLYYFDPLSEAECIVSLKLANLRENVKAENDTMIKKGKALLFAISVMREQRKKLEKLYNSEDIEARNKRLNLLASIKYEFSDVTIEKIDYTVKLHDYGDTKGISYDGLSINVNDNSGKDMKVYVKDYISNMDLLINYQILKEAVKFDGHDISELKLKRGEKYVFKIPSENDIKSGESVIIAYNKGYEKQGKKTKSENLSKRNHLYRYIYKILIVMGIDSNILQHERNINHLRISRKDETKKSNSNKIRKSERFDYFEDFDDNGRRKSSKKSGDTSASQPKRSGFWGWFSGNQHGDTRKSKSSKDARKSKSSEA